jgi:hypothetical protein
MQGFSNFFGWGPKKLSEKSRDPQEILRPYKCVNTKLITLIFHLFAVFYTIFFLLFKFGNPFWTFGNPQKGRDP